MRVWRFDKRGSLGSRKRRGKFLLTSLCLACFITLLADDVLGGDFSNGLFDLCLSEQESLSPSEETSSSEDTSPSEDTPSCDFFTEKSARSNGIFELAGVKSFYDEDVLKSQDFTESPLSASSGLFASYASQGTSESTSDATYTGDSCSFSQDVIIRGSVLNLPSLTSLQFWGNGYVGYGHVTPKDTRRVGEDLSGASFGLNVPLGIATVSTYYNYHKNRAHYDSTTIRQHSDAFGASVYLNVGDFYAVASGLYGDDGYLGRKVSTVPKEDDEDWDDEEDELVETTSVVKNSRIKGYQQTWYFETGYEMATLGLFSLQPFAAYEYANLKHGGFDVDTLDATGVTRKYNSCLATLGSRVNVNLAGMDVFALQGRMAWLTQLRKKNEAFHNFSYGRVPGTISPSQPYFLGKGAGSDYFWGGIGTRLSFKGMIAVSADYDCLINKYQTLNVGSLGLLIGF